MIVRRPLRVAAFACVAGLAGVACGGASEGDGAVAPTPAVENSGAVESVSGAVVPASLQFTAPLVGGGEIVGDELAGKPTAFWFWSPT